MIPMNFWIMFKAWLAGLFFASPPFNFSEPPSPRKEPVSQFKLQELTSLCNSKERCVLCDIEVPDWRHTCEECTRRLVEGKDSDVRLLRWWNQWGFDDKGRATPLELTSDDCVMLQPQLRLILDNWTAPLRHDSLDGKPVTWRDVHEAIRRTGLIVWCARHNPRPDGTIRNGS